jgi:hypothetical protein
MYAKMHVSAHMRLRANSRAHTHIASIHAHTLPSLELMRTFTDLFRISCAHFSSMDFHACGKVIAVVIASKHGCSRHNAVERKKHSGKITTTVLPTYFFLFWVSETRTYALEKLHKHICQHDTTVKVVQLSRTGTSTQTGKQVRAEVHKPVCDTDISIGIRLELRSADVPCAGFFSEHVLGCAKRCLSADEC